MPSFLKNVNANNIEGQIYLRVKMNVFGPDSSASCGLIEKFVTMDFKYKSIFCLGSLKEKQIHNLSFKNVLNIRKIKIMHKVTHYEFKLVNYK